MLGCLRLCLYVRLGQFVYDLGFGPFFHSIPGFGVFYFRVLLIEKFANPCSDTMSAFEDLTLYGSENFGLVGSAIVVMIITMMLIIILIAMSKTMFVIISV